MAPDQNRVLELLKYNRKTGVLRWKVKRRGTATAGSVAGSVHRGYIVVRIDGVDYPAHTVIWFMLTGRWRPDGIDHCDFDGTNNRPGNLREATKAQNAMHRRRRSDNASGAKGVTKRPEARYRRRPYVARITVDGKLRALGYYATRKQAKAAYACAAEHHFGEFAHV